MTFAYVVVTLISYGGEPLPSELQFITSHPVVCNEYIDEALPQLLEAGFDAIAQCHYTHAPLDPIHPRLRKTDAEEN